jgi:molybdenum cofactor cytidylyltransferase
VSIASVDCIMPVAGRSERFGGWKPLTPFRGNTIVGTTVKAALAACDRVILVTGYRGGELGEGFAGEPRVVVVENPDWELGMFSSIRRGAGSVETARFFIMLADKPFVGPEVYRALLERGGADFVFPVHAGQRGHPVLAGSRVRDAILAADPATGSMKGIVARLSVIEVPWPDDSVLRDIDRPEDLAGA